MIVKVGKDGLDLFSNVTGTRYVARPNANMMVADKRDHHLFQKQENELIEAGLSSSVVKMLNDAGVSTVADLRTMIDNESLTDVKGIGEKTASEIAEVLDVS